MNEHRFKTRETRGNPRDANYVSRGSSNSQTRNANYIPRGSNGTRSRGTNFTPRGSTNSQTRNTNYIPRGSNSTRSRGGMNRGRGGSNLREKPNRGYDKYLNKNDDYPQTVYYVFDGVTVPDKYGNINLKSVKPSDLDTTSRIAIYKQAQRIAEAFNLDEIDSLSDEPMSNPDEAQSSNKEPNNNPESADNNPESVDNSLPTKPVKKIRGTKK